MEFYIPRIGDQIQLTKAWAFEVQKESRNDSLIQKILSAEADIFGATLAPADMKNGAKIRATLPKDTILSISRVYIRQGDGSYDSVTFVVKNCPIKKFEKCRFWVSVKWANTIHFEKVNTQRTRNLKIHFFQYVPNRGCWTVRNTDSQKWIADHTCDYHFDVLIDKKKTEMSGTMNLSYKMANTDMQNRFYMRPIRTYKMKLGEQEITCGTETTLKKKIQAYLMETNQ